MSFLVLIVVLYLLTFIFFTYLTVTLYIKVGKQKKRKHLLRPMTFYKISGWIFLAFTLLAPIVIFYIDEEINQDVLLAALIWLFVQGSCSLYFILYGINHRVRFDSEIVDVYDIRGRLNSIQWSEFSSAKYNPGSGYIVIHGKNRRLKIHLFMSNLKLFVDEMEQNTNWTRNKLNIPDSISIMY